MPRTIPFVGPSYDLDTGKADRQRSVNLFPVANEVAGGKTGSYLQSVPGLDVFSAAPPPPPPPHVCADGPVWADSTLPLLNYFSASHGNGVFVAGGQTVGSAKNTSVSVDGISWFLSSNQAPLPNQVSRLVFGNGIFFANDISGAAFASSPSGAFWTAIPALNGIVTTAGIAFGAGVFVVTDNVSNQVLSTDGLGGPWVTHALPGGFIGRAVVWTGTVWLVSENGSLAPRVFSSPDLVTWTQVGTQASNTFGTIEMAYGGGVVVASSGASSAFIMYSLNQGVTWINTPLAHSGVVDTIKYQQGAFIITQSSFVSNSVDGIAWALTASQITPSTPGSRWTFASDGAERYIAVNAISGGSTLHAVGIC